MSSALRRMSDPQWPRVATLKTPEAFRGHLTQSGIALPFDDALCPAASSPLAQSLEVDGVRVGNRFCILPMEGWDGTADGEPTDLTFRRWRNFGRSGAKLIWGGEAVAVREDGRANPNQLMIGEGTLSSLERLRRELVAEHKDRFGAQADRDLYVGLQLTHSGRLARPHEKDRPEPLVAYAHPVLDRRFPGGTRVITDAELGRAGRGLRRPRRGARPTSDTSSSTSSTATATWGTSSCPHGRARGATAARFENRTRFLREIVAGIRAEAPGLARGRAPLRHRHAALSAGRERGRGARGGRRATTRPSGLLRDEQMDEGPRRQPRVPEAAP